MMQALQREPYCSRCGTKVEFAVPDGDNRERRVCASCDFVHYKNPVTVCGAVVFQGDKVLLCKRAIEPQHGLWTLPAGFMECGESAEDGAKREAMEEANVELSIRGLLGVYSLPHIDQVQLIYLADLVGEKFSAGIESLEVRLFAKHDIPWDELAFTTVDWALKHAWTVRTQEVWPVESRTKTIPLPM